MKSTIRNHSGKAISQEILREAVLLDEYIKHMTKRYEVLRDTIEDLLIQECSVQGGNFIACLEATTSCNVPWQVEAEKIIGAAGCDSIRALYRKPVKRLKIRRVSPAQAPVKINVADSNGNELVIERAA